MVFLMAFFPDSVLAKIMALIDLPFQCSISNLRKRQINQCVLHQIMTKLKSKIVKQRSGYMSEAFEKSGEQENVRYTYVYIDNCIFEK